MTIEDNIYPVSELLVKMILAKKPMHRKFLLGSISELTDEEKLGAENYINYLLSDSTNIEYLSECYLTIVQDMFREEMHFKQTGRYRCSSYAEAAALVYDNCNYMHKYMLGLALSSYWWINHIQMLRFFKKSIPANQRGIYREIGPGHGLYFLEAMKNSDYDLYEGIDISATSVELANRIVTSGYFGIFVKAKIWQGDFLTEQFANQADALVMGEVLEHVENAELFLRRAHEVTTDNAFIFLTTCINSPAVDHIYNPETMNALEDLIDDSGFNIVDKCLMPKQGCSLEQCKQEKLPINVALVIAK